MLDTDKIEAAIDAFVLTGAEETYTIFIPARDGKPRKYLGLSALGEECVRKVWYQWRHCAFPKFPPRLLRLFRRGDIEEYRFNYLLRGIGFEIFEVDAEGKQFKVSDYEGHLSGHMDGVAKAPIKFWVAGSRPHPFLTEYKSYNDSRFNKLRKEGVAKSDPKYYSQLQSYMGYEGLKGALFCAVNKNDDTLYFKWIPFNKAFFAKEHAKAGEIICATKPPNKLRGASMSWYQCGYCDFKEICHKGKASVKSCRSCAFAVPVENAQWKCTKNKTYGTVCKLYSDIAKA